jgi:hypothetical protein
VVLLLFISEGWAERQSECKGGCGFMFLLYVLAYRFDWQTVLSEFLLLATSCYSGLLLWEFCFVVLDFDL